MTFLVNKRPRPGVLCGFARSSVMLGEPSLYVFGAADVIAAIQYASKDVDASQYWPSGEGSNESSNWKIRPTVLDLVELEGIEPSTSSMPLKRSPK